jgi:hypothetical protein
MNKIKRARYIFSLDEVVREGAAHVVHLGYEIGVQFEWATVVMHPICHRVMRLPLPHPREDMHFISHSLERCGELYNV